MIETFAKLRASIRRRDDAAAILKVEETRIEALKARIIRELGELGIELTPSNQDISAGGTRRIYKVRNVMDAIHVVLPVNDGAAMTVGQVHAAMLKQGFTYAYITVAIGLQRMWDDNYTDKQGHRWHIYDSGTNNGKSYPCRKQWFQRRMK